MATDEAAQRTLSAGRSARSPNDRVVLNIGGQRFDTYLGTLNAVPHTRLCWIAQRHPFSAEYDPASAEYFFDRHPGVFNAVLNYYRTGKLHCPTHICASEFVEELAFWGINPQNMESCCWVHYRNHIKNEKSLGTYAKDHKTTSGTGAGRSGTAVHVKSESCGSKRAVEWERYKKMMWTILEKPNSTTASKVYVVFSSVFIISMLLQFCLGSLPRFFNDPYKTYVLKKVFEISSIYFTLEFLMRVLLCPNKATFLKSVMNWVDFLNIVPYYMSLFFDDEWTMWLVPLKALRLYRLFSLSVSFQIMLKAIVASVNELLLGLGTIVIPAILFSCFIYLAEKDQNTEMFANVPESFWWAIVTMTTLGYGDKVPATALGKMIGVTCALCGVVIIALPISVIGNNFYFHYTQARIRKKKPSKETIATAIAHIPLLNLRVFESQGNGDTCTGSDFEFPSAEGDDGTVQEDRGASPEGQSSFPRRKLVTIT